MIYASAMAWHCLARLKNWLFLSSVLALTLATMSSHAQEKHQVTDVTPSRVFFVHYRHTGFETSEDIRTGFVEGMTEIGARVSVQADHIRFGLEQFSDEQNIAQEVLLKSIEEWDPHLLVVHSLQSAKAFTNFDSSKFAKWPILFVATIRLPEGLKEAYPNSTAILDQFPLKENIELAQKLHADADRIIIIGSSNKIENVYRFRMAENIVAQWNGRANLITMFDTPANTLYREIGDSETKDVVIDLKDYIDENGGKVYVDNFMATMQAKQKPVPIYSFWQPTRDYKITGGLFFNEKQKGYYAAQTANKILTSGSAKNIPIQSINNSRPMFFWEELKRHNIARSALPDGAIIFNEPRKLTKTQWRVLGIVIVFVCFLISFIIYLLRSIQKQRAAELKVRAAKDEAERANKVKSRFLANMSHEIRTPMNAILGFSDILLTKELPPEQREHINAINTSGRALMTLINDILDLSKVESGKIELRKHTSLSRAIFKETESIFRLAAEQKRLAFSLKWDKRIPKFLMFDDVRLRQVIFNLVGNAIKFTEEGFVEVSVSCQTLDIKAHEMDLKIEVSDSGIGINEHNLGTIFEEFVQQEGQDSRKYGGTGLGLTISKRLVELMGGYIHVRSIEGQGTTFTIILPKIEIPNTEPHDQEGQLASNASSFGGTRVVIAEDNTFNQQLFAEMARQLKIDLEIAENGQIAVDIIQSNPPDLAIFDIEMPVMDGIEAIEILRQSESTQHLPIMVVSATDRDDINNLIKRLNLIQFAKKPITKEELRAFIQEALETSEANDTDTDTETKLSTDESINPKLSRSQISRLVDLDTPELATAAKCRDIEFIQSHVSSVEDLSKDFMTNDLSQYIETYRSACSNFEISTLVKAHTDYRETLNSLK